MARLAAPLLALALIAPALGGCGGDDKTKTVTVTKEAGEKTATATPKPGATPGAIITGEGTGDDNRFRFVLTELKRSGPTVIANARVELAEGNQSNSFQVSDQFNDGLYQPLESGTNEGGDVFDGIALIDPQGKKKYLVARDSQGRCVCSNDLSSAFAGPGTPVNLQATLTAPPPAVKQVDVVVPSVKTFTRVPISE
jgi:hypothetical protein